MTSVHSFLTFLSFFSLENPFCTSFPLIEFFSLSHDLDAHFFQITTHWLCTSFFTKYMMFSVFFSIWHEQNWKHPRWGGNLFLAIVTRSHLLLSCMNTKLCSRIEWWCDWVAAAQCIPVGRVSLGVWSGDWNSFQCPDVCRGRVMTGTCPRCASKGWYRFPTRILYLS